MLHACVRAAVSGLYGHFLQEEPSHLAGYLFAVSRNRSICFSFYIKEAKGKKNWVVIENLSLWAWFAIDS